MKAKKGQTIATPTRATHRFGDGQTIVVTAFGAQVTFAYRLANVEQWRLVYELKDVPTVTTKPGSLFDVRAWFMDELRKIHREGMFFTNPDEADANVEILVQESHLAEAMITAFERMVNAGRQQRAAIQALADIADESVVKLVNDLLVAQYDAVKAEGAPPESIAALRGVRESARTALLAHVGSLSARVTVGMVKRAEAQMTREFSAIVNNATGPILSIEKIRMGIAERVIRAALATPVPGQNGAADGGR